MPYSVVLSALADPTRRGIYERLRQSEHSVGDLARLAAISQPAASQHLGVLKRARLVSVRRAGNHRFYQASPEGLEALRAYLDSLRDDGPRHPATPV